MPRMALDVVGMEELMWGCLSGASVGGCCCRGVPHATNSPRCRHGCGCLLGVGDVGTLVLKM